MNQVVHPPVTGSACLSLDDTETRQRMIEQATAKVRVLPFTFIEAARRSWQSSQEWA